MAEDFSVQNKRVTQSAIINPDGSVTHFINVTFMLGTHGPFTITRPSAQFTAQAINAAIDTIRQQIQQIQ